MTDIEPKSILYCGICSWPPEFVNLVSRKEMSNMVE